MNTKPEETLGDPLPAINIAGCLDAATELLETDHGLGNAEILTGLGIVDRSYFTDWARDRGRAVHTAIEFHLTGGLDCVTPFAPRPIVTVEAAVLHGDRIVIEEREFHTEVVRLRKDGSHPWLVMLKYKGTEDGLRYALREVERLEAQEREEA